MITLLLDDELYVDSLWESFSSSASRLQRLGADPAAVRARWGRRGRRMTLSCTRERGATPSRHTADIAAATRFCLTTAGAHFRCPSDPSSGAPTAWRRRRSTPTLRVGHRYRGASRGVDTDVAGLAIISM